MDNIIGLCVGIHFDTHKFSHQWFLTLTESVYNDVETKLVMCLTNTYRKERQKIPNSVANSMQYIK